MGGASSIDDQATFRELQRVYEENKDDTDDVLLAKCQVACAPKEAPKAETEEDDEAKKERSKLFLFACGAYRKETSTAKANLTEATNLFHQGIDLDYVDEEGWTALHHAAGEGHTKLVEFLLNDCKVRVDPVDEFNCTPLWVACCNDRRDAVKALLVVGADTEITGKPEGEPVQKPALAARRNRHPGLADLVDAEAELRTADVSRLQREITGEMTLQEFNDSMRQNMKNGGNQGGAI